MTEFRVLDSSMKELKRTMDRLDKQVATKAGKKALSAGSKIMVSAIRSKITGYLPTLKKSIGSRLLRPRYPGVITRIIGHRTGKKSSSKASKGPANDAWYGHIFEFGTLGSRSAALSGKTKRKPHKSPLPSGLKAVPHMRPAWDEKKNVASNAMIQKLWALIKQAAK